MRSTSGVMVQDTLSQIAEAIAGIQFGCVQITVRDARVVQIDTTQKIRVDRKAHLPPGGLTEPLSCADQTAGGKRPSVEQHGHASGDAVARS